MPGGRNERRISERRGRSRRKSLAHESGSRFGDNSRRRRSYVSVDPSPPTPRKKENSCIVNSGWDLL